MADRRKTEGPGGVVSAVEPGSVGEVAGLRLGDRLLAINGQPLRDVIDARFYAAEDELDLVVERDGEPLRISVEREFGQPLGLEFTHPTFDVDIRRCTNRCEFCFVQMNAPGMRRSLSIKDDDYRYSFLFGNFVTLTNLTAADWERLEEQRLSPLYISVHATEPDLRRRLLGSRWAPDVLDQLRRLADVGIEVHTQVVLVPGINDGEYLDRTLADLLALLGRPVQSVGIVPVGLTRFHRGSCRPYTAGESARVLDQVEAWRKQSRRQTGCTFVYPSDEWYLVAGRDVPTARQYDGFPQLENGVGMVRQLLDEWSELRRSLSLDRRRSPDRAQAPATLVCGTLIAPVLERIVQEWRTLSGAQLRLVPVTNRFFGPVTTVSGLLTGQNVVAALQEAQADSSPLPQRGGRRGGDLVLLPRAMFTGRYGAGDAPPGVTLDDMSIDEISAQLGVRVEMAGTLSEALAVLAG
jgi:putative radical SAM enzyme (TIGR03279 family)